MFKLKRVASSPHAMAAIDFGYTLLASVLVFGGGGYWLDKRNGWLPWCTLLGVGLGLAVGFNSLFKRLARLEKIDKARRTGPPKDTDPRKNG